MKYLVAVKLNGESEIFEFPTIEARQDFIESVGDDVDIATSEAD
jgi:hypothetical protein